MSNKFDSEGFDLDALSATDNGNVVLEIGGGTTVLEEQKQPEQEPDTPLNELETAESWKQQGNQQFKLGNFLEAYDLYTEAIQACPGDLKGEQILQLRDDFLEAEREKAMAKVRESSTTTTSTSTGANADTKQGETTKRPEPVTFQLPRQPHGKEMAVYYCNRAAALLQLQRYDEAIPDCDVASMLDPTYTKAYVRRSTAYEQSGKTEEALRDAKKALELEPSNATIRKTAARLQKAEDERLEQLKEETLGKLKDLGNSILGNFGLSLDNFQAVQDPSTGSYNISFNQSK
eukprot:Nitzschia sp. Nitz4//scaffold96_size78090//15265//16134//NITZ4_005486-RA/size78090-processed-gene-0.45-mRNA-1//-1//CDS//3329560549//379//frame0